jgi:hypothetical protein
MDADDPVLPAATQGGVAMGLTSLSFHQVPPADPSANARHLRRETARLEKSGRENFEQTNPGRVNEESFSFSRENLQISVQFHLEKRARTETGPFFGADKMDLSFQYEKIELMIAAEHPRFSGQNSAVPWEELARHFSVQNTADRITRFVTNGFGKTSFGEANRPESRREFVDFILPHIREGVDSALSLFGTIPTEVVKNAEATYDRIQESLVGFAEEEDSAEPSRT